MLSKAKDWALNVLMVFMIGVCMIGAGMAVSQWLMYLRGTLGGW